MPARPQKWSCAPKVFNYDNYVAVDTWTKIAINNTDYNDQSAFDAGNNRFVAPVHRFTVSKKRQGFAASG